MVSSKVTQGDKVTEENPSDNAGFILGVNKKNDGHFINESAITAMKFTCTKK